MMPKGGIEAVDRIARPVRLTREVYDVVLRRLMSLEIAPGERIGVDALGRELDVSQTPVREALNQLEALGLVVKVHLSGYRAAPQLSASQFADLCELRLLVEPALAAKAARLMSDAERRRLAALAARMNQAACAEVRLAYTAFAEADARFHAGIAEGARNALLCDILTRQAVHLRLFRLRLSARATTEALAEHGLIVEALLAGDPDAAAAAMRAHVEQASARFADIFA